MTPPTIKNNRIREKPAVKNGSASDAKRTTEEILLLGITSALPPENEKRLSNLLDGDVDWEYLLDLAEYHGITPLLAYNLSPISLADKIPVIYLDMLSRIYHNNVCRNLFLSDELVKILAQFNRNKIDAITLKGTVLGEQLYVNPGLRTTSDIDILVRPEKVPKADTIIREMGYEESTIREELEHPFHHVYYKKEKFPFMVEIHWDLDDPKMEAGNREEIWRRARRYRFQGGATMVLSPEDTLLYLAANLLTQDGQQLKYLGDITELLKKYPDNFDWNYVTGTGRSLGISATTYYALKWARELLQAPVPEPVFTALEPSLPRRFIISCLISQRTLLSPVSWTKLRNETTALARGLMMGRTRQTLTVLTKYRGYKKKAAWLRTAAWIPLVFGTSLWLNVRNFYTDEANNKIPINNYMNSEEAVPIRKKAFSLLKQHGILKFTWLVFRYFLRKTIRLSWQKIYILERSLKEPIQAITPKINVRIEQVGENEIHILKDIVDKDKYRRFQDRLRKGRVCIAALDGDRATGFGWISLEDECETDSSIEVKLNDKEAYLYDSYVSPEYRNNKLYAAMLAEEMRYLKSRGYDKAIALIDSENATALKTVKAAGYYPEKTAVVFTVFGRKFHRWRNFRETSNPLASDIKIRKDTPNTLRPEKGNKLAELSIEEVNDVEGFRSLKETWDTLLQQSDDNNVFLTWEWLFMWWQHYGQDKRLRIFLIKDQEEIIGIAPFVQRQYRKGFFHINLLENICAEECDYSGVILTKQIDTSMAILLDYIDKIAREDKTVVRIWHVPEKSSFLKALKKEHPSYAETLTLDDQISSHCLYIDLPATWEIFYQSLGKKTRKNLRRFTNLLKKDAKVEFRKFTGDSDLRNNLETLFHLHQKRWQERNIGSKFLEPKAREFYVNVSEAFLEKDWLDLSFLDVEGKTVSIEWGFNYNGCYWNMTGSFDPDYSRYSVGNIHAMYLIKAAIDSGQRKYDMLKGTESYKSHFTENKASNILITLNHNSLMSKYRVKILDIFIKFDNSRARSLRENLKLVFNKIKRPGHNPDNI
jgi:CelD/BcsL family acetyltransferase involved in cellulose biosynthesis/ribosomal protein S18 acetylase RimI-like enzyme